MSWKTTQAEAAGQARRQVYTQHCVPHVLHLPDCLAWPAGSVNTALSNLIRSTLTAKLSKGKSTQCAGREAGMGREVVQMLSHTANPTAVHDKWHMDTSPLPKHPTEPFTLGWGKEEMQPG